VCEADAEANLEEAQYFLAVSGFREEAVAAATRQRPVVLAGTGSALATKERWIHSLECDVERCKAALTQLQGEFAERTAWAMRLVEEVAERDAAIRRLQSLNSEATARPESAEQ
jgi:hypothetical protein